MFKGSSAAEDRERHREATSKLDPRSSPAGATLHADRCRAEIGGEPPEERAVQMREAENPTAAHAGPALEQIHATAALIAIRGEIGVPEHAEFGHRLSRQCVAALGNAGNAAGRSAVTWSAACDAGGRA
ncbi:MAG: hypothetical protein ABIP93_11080 [Gemmatimonadaceae bacterium]